MTDAIAAFSVLAWSAYVLSRVVRRRRVPELVAFLLAGAVLGPSGLKVVSESMLDRLDIATQLALAVLMFVIGERVSVRPLVGQRRLVAGSVLQFLVVALGVGLALRAVGASADLALLAGVLAGAGAPMTVSAIVTERRARGPFPRQVVAAHAASDALAAISFAAALPVAALWSGAGSDVTGALLTFLRVGAGSLVVGVVAGVVVARMAPQIETSGELLVFGLVHILAVSTLALAAGLSLPVTALAMGASAASFASEEPSTRLFVSIRSIEQPLYLLFFALAGSAIHLEALPALGAIGACYVAARTVAKVAVGALAIAPPRSGLALRLRFGTSLVPQAGVAVGLAVLAAEQLPEVGGDLAAIVLGSVVVFELIGPLLLSRNLKDDSDEQLVLEDNAQQLDRAPSVVLVASDSEIAVPDWLLTLCARSGAELVALAPCPADDSSVATLRQRAADELIDFRWLGYGGESFAAAVTRASFDAGAELVVVQTSASRDASRLALLPYERIARQVPCPVLVAPSPPRAEVSSGRRNRRPLSSPSRRRSHSP